MKQFSPHLYCIFHRLGQMPSFIIEKSASQLILVDTGLKSTAKSLVRQITKKWGSLSKIKMIILTHRHLDHTGGIPYLLELLPEVELVCHQAEAPLFNEDFKEQNITITRTVKHNDYLDMKLKLRVIHTPGHSFGHICLLFEEDHLILVGDLFMDILGKLYPVFKKFNDDFLQWRTTLPFIMEYKWDFAIPSHMQAKKIPRDKVEAFIVKNKE
ncbi:MAG: MBL fold metallo-hydrolase [Candidatus Thorarchaeota archaeon]